MAFKLDTIPITFNMVKNSSIGGRSYSFDSNNYMTTHLFPLEKRVYLDKNFSPLSPAEPKLEDMEKKLQVYADSNDLKFCPITTSRGHVFQPFQIVMDDKGEEIFRTKIFVSEYEKQTELTFKDVDDFRKKISFRQAYATHFTFVPTISNKKLELRCTNITIYQITSMMSDT